MEAATSSKKYFKELFRIFIALAILPFFWPVAIVTVCLLLSVRYLIQNVLNFIYGKNVYTLVSTSTSDGIFGHKCPGNSAIIHSVSVMKGEPNLEQIRDRYKTHLFAYNDPITGKKNIYDKYKCSLTTKLGFHCWQNVSQSFDLNQHVKYLDSIRPNEVYTEDKLMNLMGRLMSQDMSDRDMYKPQWDHLIIPNYRLNNESPDSRPGHFVCVYRVHHAYADGASFAILMDSVLSDRPLKYCVDPMKPFSGMTWWKQAFIYFKAVTVGPLDFILTLKSSIMDDSPLILRKYSQQKFVDWSKQLSLDLLKEIKQVSGASLASILVCAMTGSLRNLHEKTVIKQNAGTKKEMLPQVPKTISVGNMVVMLPYPSREMQNHFTTFSVPYPLAEENMIRRLKNCDVMGRSYLGSSEPWFHFYIMRFSSICPKVVQDVLLELPAAPIVFSNVPGIQEPFHLFHRELLEVGAWLPLFKAYGKNFDLRLQNPIILRRNFP